MRILLSNDDGVHATGIRVLYRELSKVAKVWVVAPMDEKSTTGHSLTLHKPLRLTSIDKNVYGVNGSPADCVYLGIREVLKSMPDLVVSGINRGANLGQDVFYSGTVSAAREACMLGLPAMAVSLSVNFNKPPPEERLNYRTAATIAKGLLKNKKLMEMPKHTLVNLNTPDLPVSRVKGVRVVRQGFRHYSGTVLKRRDHRGRNYFWVGGQYKGFKREKDSDCGVVDCGYASLTPLRLDTTDFDFLETLSKVVPEYRFRSSHEKRKKK